MTTDPDSGRVRALFILRITSYSLCGPLPLVCQKCFRGREFSEEKCINECLE